MLDDWDSRANCAGLPTSHFFPPDGTEEEDEAWYENEGQEVIEICRLCVVRRECFFFSITHPDSIENGVFGGTTPKDRERYVNEAYVSV